MSIIIDGNGPVSGVTTLGSVTTLTFSDSSTQSTAPIGSPAQSWQDMSASRSAGVTYTNSTGRPIMVSIRAQTGTSDCSITVNGVTAALALQTVATRNFLTVIVPNNGTYIMQPAYSTLWSELR